jgi:hypothetical protein
MTPGAVLPWSRPFTIGTSVVPAGVTASSIHGPSSPKMARSSSNVCKRCPVPPLPLVRLPQSTQQECRQATVHSRIYSVPLSLDPMATRDRHVNYFAD